MDYIIHILIMVLNYSVLAVSLNLLAGYTGLLSISHAAFYGVGAYTSALLAVHHGVPFVVGMAAGMAAAGLLSLLISLPSVRLHGDYFVMATFGLQIIAFSFFNNWIDLTNGPLGVPGIPQPTFLGWQVTTHLEHLVLAGIAAAFAIFVVWLLVTAPFGRVLYAIREDETFAHSLGKNTINFKVIVVVVAAALAAMSGSLYAHYITYIDPFRFTLMESILILAMVIVGGAGSIAGPIVGAFILVTLPELLRFVGLPGDWAANLREIIYGSLLVLLMILRPQGLIGRYAFK